ncbi:putative Multidrug resistance-associated protein [Pleurostoma richardsiae]|uniref:Multidrug resistance-associated protein n=1 Tax=Pleurostoma richardsiae TaxID=41990 RepID=A0AA38S5Q8_9PEZI|nr:putative Multidrug resistance-associated protein [Pleurostoma richardsiae]
MSSHSACPPGSDAGFGPRVDINCRSFDFTLLFEDAFFQVLPAALFLLLLPARLQYLRTTPVKLQSYRLAIWKLLLLGLLFVLHVLFMAFHVRTSVLSTSVSLTSDILGIVAVFAAAVHSFMEDQRSVAPSDILVLYFSASTTLAIPRLRSLWQIPTAEALSYLDAPQTTSTEKYGQALIGAVILVYLGIAVSGAVYWRQTYRFSTKVRSGLISVIYEHTTLLKENDLKDRGAVTLMGTDVERIVASLRFIHDTWSSVLEVGVAVYLLERQIFIACIVPVIICIVSVVATAPLSSNFRAAQKQWINWVEKRIAVTSNMLGDMKSVKMLGLGDVLSSIIIRIRRSELKASERFRKLLIAQIVISNFPTDFAPFATFAVYAIISAVKGDKSLLSAQAFESLSLISLLTHPLLMFCQAVPTLLQAVGSFDRIEEFLRRSPEPANHSSSNLPLIDAPGEAVELQGRSVTAGSNTALISFKDCDISWSPESEAAIHALTLSIRRGITMIVGPVGAGKSALLTTLIGEMTVKSGTLKELPNSVAYCSQIPWMMNETIRHNVTGDLVFDEKWYYNTLWACALEEDLKKIPGGDLFKVGSNGVALSGGQRQRVALARAVYSRLPVVILDDVFSGLDSKSISLISTRLLGQDGLFKKAGQSVILATHTQRVLSYADEIIILDNGRLVDQGPYGDILRRSPETLAKSAPLLENKRIVPIEEMDPKHSLDIALSRHSIVEEEGEPAEEVKDHLRRDGTWSVYRYYFKSAGYPLLAVFAFFCFLEGFASNFATLWFERWVDHNQKHPNEQLGMYLGVYGLLFILSLTGVAVSCWLFFVNVINNTAFALHLELLKATLRAPFPFFQKADVGSITNRFSQDMDLIDMNLPRFAILFASGASSCLVKLVVLCVVGKYLAVSTPFLALALFFIQRYYLRTSRQVRILDIEAKAPLYTHFLETVQGISTVRAFGWEGRFRDRTEELLARSQKPFYMLACIQQWLQLVLDLVVGALALVIVAMVTSLSAKFSAGSIGVALNLILTFNQNLIQAIKAWTMLETSIGAVSRVRSFVQETPTEYRGLAPLPPQDSGWPTQGSIEFQNVTAGYDLETPPALNSLTLSIPPGSKIAICGPSGSGKTSLILALLQMIPLQDGRVVIDGLDLAGIEGADLRARINVVPQDPFFTPGSVRFNLSPHAGASQNGDTESDARLEGALRKVGLLDGVIAKGGLDAELAAGEWSAGERQLLALARALLRAETSRILVLDEAASNVDAKTEAIMQDIIEREFAGQTVISVVHRLRYIDRFDRVALLKQGSLVEWDSPAALLGWDSEFRKLYLALQRAD